MTMNSHWGGGGLNPPEPMPMVKSMRDVGYMGSLPANGSGRQITKEHSQTYYFIFNNKSNNQNLHTHGLSSGIKIDRCLPELEFY